MKVKRLIITATSLGLLLPLVDSAGRADATKYEVWLTDQTNS